MIIQGKFTTAVIHTENVEDAAIEQIQQITDSPAFEGQSVHYMPDVHAGHGCTVGFAATLGDYINPSHIGGDIGCAVSHMRIVGKLPAEKYAEFEHKVRNAVPYDLQKKPVIDEKEFFKFLTRQFNKMKQQWPEHLDALPDQVTERWVSDQLKRLNMDKATFYKQLGTYSSAVSNHFIEYGEAENVSFIDMPWYNRKTAPKEDGYWYDSEYVGPDPEAYRQNLPFIAGITVHTGSRNFGQKVCRRWESVAQRSKEIPGYLTGKELEGYLCDMCFAQAYAYYNHITIQDLIKDILKKYKIRTVPIVFCPHNYIDMKQHIIHKGSISALNTETLIIPFNMRDGVAICVGKNNPDWNFSAPHGAGRLMSRNQARKNISIDEYTATMSDVYSTSVCEATIDESPMAYKPTDEIKKLIEPTVDIMYMLPSKISIKATKPEQ